MATAETVTIIITNYNHGDLLPRAVASVLSQTRPADRVVVIDDCSTDRSETVLAQLAATVEVIRREINGGVVAARNQALAAVETEFVVFLDADDELLPDFLKVTLRAFRRRPNSRLAVVYTPARMTNGSAHGYMHSRGFDRSRLAQQNYIANTSLIRRAALLDVGGYAAEMEKVGHEDWDLFLTLAERGWRGRLVARPLFLYRTLAGSRNIQSLERETEVRQVIERRHPWVAAPVLRPRPTAMILRAVTAARQRMWREVDFRRWTSATNETSP